MCLFIICSPWYFFFVILIEIFGLILHTNFWIEYGFVIFWIIWSHRSHFCKFGLAMIWPHHTTPSNPSNLDSEDFCWDLTIVIKKDFLWWSTESSLLPVSWLLLCSLILSTLIKSSSYVKAVINLGYRVFKMVGKWFVGSVSSIFGRGWSVLEISWYFGVYALIPSF